MMGAVLVPGVCAGHPDVQRWREKHRRGQVGTRPGLGDRSIVRGRAGEEVANVAERWPPLRGSLQP